VLGGYELLCADIADRFRSAGHEVFVLTSMHEAGASPEGDGVFRVLKLYAPFSRTARMERGRRRKTYRHNRTVAAKHLAELRPDIVFVWSQLRLTTGAAFAAQQLGIPVAFTMNDEHIRSFVPCTKPATLRKVARCLLDATLDRKITTRDLDLTHTACISDYLKQSLLKKGVPVSSAKVIYQGIPVEQFPCKSSALGELHQPVRLLYSGQLHEYKGVHLAISALHQLEQQQPGRYQLSIAGTGPEEYVQRLRSQAESLNLSSLVQFEGLVPRTDMARHYRENDILLMTSLWEEPFGLTHLESMASGTPVISTFRGGMKEFLVNEKNCLLFDPDRPEHLARQIERLVSDESLRTHLAKTALEEVGRCFSDERYAADLLQFLTQIVNQSESGAT
jgi:glycosyltransferase involved in cell wall biosynthesis